MIKQHLGERRVRRLGEWGHDALAFLGGWPQNAESETPSACAISSTLSCVGFASSDSHCETAAELTPHALARPACVIPRLTRHLVIRSLSFTATT